MSNLRFEVALLTKIIDEENLSEPLRLGITADHFSDEDCRKVWSYILVHHADPKRRGIPSRDVIESRFPTFDFIEVRDKMPVIVEQVRENLLYGQVRELLTESRDVAQAEDARKALAVLKTRVLSLSAQLIRPELVDLTQSAEEVKAHYRKAKELGGVTGIPWPWPALTKATGGAKDGTAYCFAGRPGVGKTMVLMHIANHWHTYAGKVVLFVSKEMQIIELRIRGAAIFCGADLTAVDRGRLSPKEEREFFDNLDAWAESDPYVVKEIRTTGMDALSEIIAIADDIGAQAVFIDGFYFLAERDASLTALLTTAVKEEAKASKRVYVINTQLNQEAENTKGSYDRTTGGSYGDTYAQDMDGFLKIRSTPEDRSMREMVIFPVKLRGGVGMPFAIHAMPGLNMSQKYVLPEDQGGWGYEMDTGQRTDSEVVE